jgi:hypothetical protein
MQGKLFHHSIDDSFLGRGIGQESFFQAAEKGQKLRDDDMHGWIIVFTELAQSGAFYDFVPFFNRGIRNIFTDDDFE